MVEVRLRRQVRLDLVAIRHYTLARYGGPAADAYLRGLGESIDRLALHPLSGIAEPDLAEGIRSLRYRKHRVYYRVADDRIEILRVFHHAQLVRSERLDVR